MKSKVQIAGHPLHPMLIVVPAGAFITALVFDIVYLLTGSTVWWEATAPLMLVGVIGGLIAAIPGLVDLFAVAPRQNARGIGIWHMGINIVIVLLFAWNAWLRWDAVAPPALDGVYGGFWLTLIGVLLLAVSGWLGWTMVYSYHVGVIEHPESKDPDPRARGGPEERRAAD